MRVNRSLLFPLVCLLLALPLLVAVAPAAPGSETSPAATKDENLSYDISFLLFNRLAEGRLSISNGENPGTYLAVLEARTLGAAAWLTRDRVHLYRSAMVKDPAGGFRSLYHESLVLRGKGKSRKERAKKYLFDHEQRQIRYQRAKENGEIYHDEILPMGSDCPNDILTAMYNFRVGALGPIVPGARYVIPTFSHRGTGDITIEVLGGEKRPHDSFFPDGGILCKVQVDQEVFDTGEGVLYVWFDAQGRPAMGLVENVVGMGHVRGVLRE